MIVPTATAIEGGRPSNNEFLHGHTGSQAFEEGLLLSFVSHSLFSGPAWIHPLVDVRVKATQDGRDIWTATSSPAFQIQAGFADFGDKDRS